MELTHLTSENYIKFFEDYPEQGNLRYQITHWINMKKKVLPDWHQYAFDSNGNVFYKFLLSEYPSWEIVRFDNENEYSYPKHDSLR
jgi:hypothetical protein